jgi:DNA-binding PadR family transcriptional regulator
MDHTDPRVISPMSESTLYILISLANGPMHGYAIAKEVKALSNNRVILSISTLYTTIKHLLEDGWIERVFEDADPDDIVRPRKLYRLTERGKSILGSERERLRSLLTLVQTRTAREET